MGEAVGRIGQIVVDCLHPTTLARFWGVLLGAQPALQDPSWASVRDPRSGLVVAFQEVPEPKSGKNRLHIDLEVSNLENATTACIALGATAEGPVVDDDDGSFQVMLDPEGHEFCLVV